MKPPPGPRSSQLSTKADAATDASRRVFRPVFRLSGAVPCAISLLLYALLMPQLYRVFGPGVEAIAVLAVVLGAAGFGLRGGLAVSSAIVVYHLIAYSWLLDVPLGRALLSGSLPANVVLPLVGAVVGRLHDLGEQLNQEMANAAHVRAELQARSVEANAANQAKGDFLARMSHEIRTPMHGVIGMSQLLLESHLAERQREYTEMIRSSANALLLIVNDILDFSKVEAGRLNLDPIDYELSSVIEEVAALMRVQAEAKGLSLVLLSTPQLPDNVQGDPGRLRQILINLIGNALKFTERGEVLLMLEVVAHADTSTDVAFTVRDTGIGMAEAQTQRIFEPFQQGDDSSTRSRGGTGLGLAISQELVELMGGRIVVTSQLGQGSAFSFTLRMPHGERPLMPMLPDLPDGPSPAHDLRGVRAILVSEGAQLDETLLLRLRALGLRIKRFTSIDAALETVRRDAGGPDPVRLCLLDVRRVDQPALDLARLMTADPNLAATVPILVAEETSGVSSREVEAAGFAAFLEQPIDQTLLGEGLRAAVGLGAIGRATRKRTFMVTRHSVVAQKRPDRPRALLAEDNRINQVIAVKLLEGQGLRVDVVGDGAQAADAAEQHRYAVIFMDCLMPNVDGFEATRRIRSQEAQAGIAAVPIIAMTASAMVGDRERTTQAGMSDFLAKPVEHGALERVLTRWLPGRRAAVTQTRTTGRHRVDLPIDPAILGNLKRAGGPEVVRVAVDLFLEAGHESLAEIAVAVAEGTSTEVRMVVHRFKGSCGSVGARTMATICGRMEQAAGAGPLVLEGELEALKAEFRKVEHALRAYRASGSGAFKAENVAKVGAMPRADRRRH